MTKYTKANTHNRETKKDLELLRYFLLNQEQAAGPRESHTQSGCKDRQTTKKIKKGAGITKERSFRSLGSFSSLPHLEPSRKPREKDVEPLRSTKRVKHAYTIFTWQGGEDWEW